MENEYMKKHSIIIACILVSASMLTGCSSEQDTQTIAELQSAVDDLQSQVDAYSKLQSDLESANDSIAELQSQLDTITTEKDAMTSKLDALHSIEAMDETMYVISEADIYDDLYDGLLGNEASGTISAEQEIKVTGKSTVIDWFEIDVDGTKKYISASLVSETKPSQQASGGNTKNTASAGNTGSQSSGGGTTQPSGEASAQSSEGGSGSPGRDWLESMYGPGSGGAGGGANSDHSQDWSGITVQ